MPIFHAIAAMSENRVIGDHGKIPWHLPEDFRWFKHKTMGGILIMGRKTFESIGKPLPGRKTAVLSRITSGLSGVTVYNNIETFKAETTPDVPNWICGGSEIYSQFLPQCTALYLLPASNAPSMEMPSSRPSRSPSRSIRSSTKQPSSGGTLDEQC